MSASVQESGADRRSRLTPARAWLLAVLAIVVVLALVAWLQRKDIARGYADDLLAQRGVPARYEIAGLGFGGQRLTNVVLGDPANPDTGIVELVVLEGSAAGPAQPDAPTFGFFLLSLQRDVDATLDTLTGLGFDDGVRRIEMPAPGGKRVDMAVITAPDGVRVELIGPPR